MSEDDETRSEQMIKAEALMEAADEWYTDSGPAHALSAVTWLHDRAQRLLDRHHRPPCVDGSVCGEAAHCPPSSRLRA